MEMFELRHVSFFYPGQTRPALDDVSLTVGRGEFLVLCGPSGCGKTTLLRQLKPALAPGGALEGEIRFAGEPLADIDPRRQAQEIGFVLQSPEDQIVTHKVWHELAFGLESLGLDLPVIRRRVAEIAAFFGIQPWFYQDVDTLSGGQKQLLNLAAVMVMQPDVLILDEPTAMLDPVAAADLLATVGRINRELGTTVLLTEHRLEEALPLADRVAVLEAGRVLALGAPGEVGLALRERGHAMFQAMPTPMRVWAAVPAAGETCPVTVREGRAWLADLAARRTLGETPPIAPRRPAGEAVLEAEELWFRYEKDGPDVVKGLSLRLEKGELMAVLGGNGAGKTTALKLLAGLLKPDRGAARRTGAVGVLPQSPQALFVKQTVGEDLEDALGGRGLSPEDRAARGERVVNLCALEGLLARHPYDLSEGERQRAALAKVLLPEPRILLLDEPTRGLDPAGKAALAGILRDLLAQGVGVLMVSHDVEFCAQYAHTCALFFDGGLTGAAPPRAFFSGNRFYTTAANRMARDLLPQAVTPADVIAACGGEVPAEPERPPSAQSAPPPSVGETQTSVGPRRLPRWRKLAAGCFAAVALAVLLHFFKLIDLTPWLVRAGIANRARRQIWLYGLLAGSLMGLGLALGRRRPPPERARPAVSGGGRRGLSRRAVLAAGAVLLLAPLTLWAGTRFLDSRKYYVTALLLLLECMAPFFIAFEGRGPRARELVTVAVLCAVGVAGRLVFVMLPEFKPVLAVTVVAGAALGSETGFLVGALTMLTSNMLLSQGPWTPWQMFAMGLVGFLAGCLFHSGLARPRRGALCVFGAAAALLVYGGIMNLQSALTWSDTLNAGILLSYCAAGFPMDCIHAAATWVFLWFGGEAMLGKLERVREKFGPGA